jgi:predicted transposase YdaD
MRSVAELFRDEARAEAEAKGRAKGRSEGRAEGRAEGLRATLRKQMKLKFGVVSDTVSGRIDDASIEELDRRVERILVATSAEDVVAG